MAKFNAKKVTTPKTVINRAGGEAYDGSNKFKLVSLLLTSFGQDQYYRSESQTYQELRDLIAKTDPEFVAKAAIYARDKFNMRTISHVAAAELCHVAKGMPNLRNFLNKVVVRADDMSEILSYYVANYGAKNRSGKTFIPKAMKAGFQKVFNRMDEYALAKYRMPDKDWSMVDIVNVVRPVPNDRNREALHKLMRDELRNVDTWESKLSSGQDKEEAWSDLLIEGKLGYMALLRNLRNILEQAPKLIDLACKQLTDPEQVAKSRQLPFRFVTAYRQIEQDCYDKPGVNKVLKAISAACDISCKNVPAFDNTLVVIDSSGSMMGNPIRQAVVLGAALLKGCDADLMLFSDNAHYVRVDQTKSVIGIAKDIEAACRMGGTNFNSIFQTARRAYDRIVILSDMQAWVGHNTPKKAFEAYKQKYMCVPYIYSFDLAGYGTLQFPENKVFAMAGYSDKVFDLFQMLETDPKALLSEIDKITF
jgi:60 kDa SS-A/Ro ribonucleoprotein